MRALVISLLLAAVHVAGCVAPATTPGWQVDAETGIAWRPVSDDEMAAAPFEGYHRAYIFRVADAQDDLRAKEEMTLQLRVHGGFIEVDVRHDGELTTGALRLDATGGDGFITQDGVLRLHLWIDGWRYDVSFVRTDFGLADDAEPADLVNRIKAPCAEWSDPGQNGTAACVRYETLDGY